MIAAKVYSNIKNDTQDMPEPNLSNVVADEYFKKRFIDGIPNNVGGNIYNYNNLVGSAYGTYEFYKNSVYEISETTKKIAIQFAGNAVQNVPFNITLHSTPTIVGSGTINSSGKIMGSFTIPDSVPVGYHELHLEIPTIEGDMYDSYEIIYVAYSEDDVDGDGIKNEADSCRTVAQTDVDEDKDSVDDACDGNVAGVSERPTFNDALRIASNEGLFTQQQISKLAMDSGSQETIGLQSIEKRQTVTAARSESLHTTSELRGESAVNPKNGFEIKPWVVGLLAIIVSTISIIVLRTKLLKQSR